MVILYIQDAGGLEPFRKFFIECITHVTKMHWSAVLLTHGHTIFHMFRKQFSGLTS